MFGICFHNRDIIGVSKRTRSLYYECRKCGKIYLGGGFGLVDITKDYERYLKMDAEYVKDTVSKKKIEEIKKDHYRRYRIKLKNK